MAKVTLTISQIAKELGVTRQAVHKKIKQEPLSTSLQQFTSTVDGVVYIDVDGLNLLKQAFGKDRPSTKFTPVDSNKFTAVDTQVDTRLTDVLADTVALLNEQLEAKDKQLAEKDKQIAELLKLNNQQQQLLLIEQQKSLPAPEPERKRWFFFRTGEGKNQ